MTLYLIPNPGETVEQMLDRLFNAIRQKNKNANSGEPNRETETLVPDACRPEDHGC